MRLFIAIFAYQSLKLDILVTGWTNIFKIPKKLIYICLPISSIIMLIYTIKNVIKATVDFFTFKKETQ